MNDRPDTLSAWANSPARSVAVDYCEGRHIAWATANDGTPSYAASGATVPAALAALARQIEDAE